jgi:hypothetical protein
MFKHFTEQKKCTFWSVLKKLFFLVPIGIVVYVIHLDSLQMKQRYAQILEEKKEFLGNFDIFVVQSGYLKKKAGFQEIYIPSLRIRVSNLSGREFINLVFNASFQRDGKSFCRGAAKLMRLRPLETKDIYLRCIDSAVFGSLVSGLSLMETTGEIRYKVSLNHRDISVTAAEGSLEFSLLAP